MTRINILTAKQDGHETIYAPESIELRMDLTQVLTFIRGDRFYVAVTFVCPNRDDSAETVQVGREASRHLATLGKGEEAAWRETGKLPECTRELLHVACTQALMHEIDEMWHDADGVREADPHTGCKHGVPFNDHCPACGHVVHPEDANA